MDRIQREDFNADDLKAEQALGALAAQTVQIANCGNCQICTTYTGVGNTTARTLPLPAKPVGMISNAAGNGNMIFWQGMQSSSYTIAMTWSGNTVTW